MSAWKSKARAVSVEDEWKMNIRKRIGYPGEYGRPRCVYRLIASIRDRIPHRLRRCRYNNPPHNPIREGNKGAGVFNSSKPRESPPPRRNPAPPPPRKRAGVFPPPAPPAGPADRARAASQAVERGGAR